MVVGLEVALADGRLIRTGGSALVGAQTDLTQLFVGSEGTLGVITEARMRAHPRPTASAGVRTPSRTLRQDWRPAGASCGGAPRLRCCVCRQDGVRPIL